MKNTGTTQECYQKKHNECPLIDHFMDIEISCHCVCHIIERVLIKDKAILDRLAEND